MMHDKLIPKKAVAAGSATPSSTVLIAHLLEQFSVFSVKRHCSLNPFAVRQTMANPLALYH